MDDKLISIERCSLCKMLHSAYLQLVEMSIKQTMLFYQGRIMQCRQQCSSKLSSTSNKHYFQTAVKTGL